ncbi:MAG TPA: G5 domain-containing protein [Anaerolineales bacterium]|nr:G5 domain-containing protein [Anaerolineales bacterium]
MHRIFLNSTLLALLLAVSTLTACRSPQVTGEDITIRITADGQTRDVALPAGSTVSQAFQTAGITIGNLDKSEPPLYTVLNTGDSVTLIRVVEKFETEEQIVPFERQVVRNESLPNGETRLVQAGVNGLRELTYRIVLEDDEEISRSIVKSVTLQEGAPEIVMVGAQSSFAPLPIPGKIAYLAGGNAWLIDTSTANRTPIVTTGDLDGRIFFLSPNGNYLVFTRKSTKPADKEINTIWAVRTNGGKPFSTGIANVVHYAEWIPGTNSIAYSTVEPRSAAPGWQANNDLHRYSITTGARAKVLDASSGGVYGWWGMVYSFSPDGRLAYARPDGIGLVDIDGKYIKPPFIDIVPFNTHSDWAWLPSLTWGADGKTLFYTSHAPPPSLVNDEDSPFFDLSAVSFSNDANVEIVKRTGMFAYPSSSYLQPSSMERQYQVAYLQAIFPEQSETSRYRVVVMDRDGSNRRTIFPANDAPGLQPQIPVWAPGQLEGQIGDFIAVVYQGDLWLVDSGNGQAYQVTGDGLVTRIDWK